MPLPSSSCVRQCVCVNDTFVSRVDDTPPILPPEAEPPTLPEQQLLKQMRRDLLDGVHEVVKAAHEETLEQHRFFIKDSLEQQRLFIKESLDGTASLQDLMSRVFAQNTEIAQVLANVVLPQQELAGGSLDALVLTNGDVAQPAATKIVMNSETVIASPVIEQDGVQNTDPAEVKVKTLPDRGATWVSEQSNTMVIKPETPIVYNTDGFCVTIVNSDIFHNTSLVMICANAVYIGVEKDWNFSDTLSGSHWAFQLSEHFFCAFFFTELALRFGAYKNKRDSLADKWFLLDAAMVVMMVIETWIFSIILSFLSSKPNTGAVGGIGRMFRLLRLTRISKLMQIVPELVTMVKGMIAAIRAVHAALLILALLVYVSAIIINALVGEEEELEEYFQTVRHSMVTLLVQGVLLDEISGLVNAMLSVGNVFSVLVFGIFVLLSAVTVMNMLIGVLCQVVLDVSSDEKENHVKSQMTKTLLVMLQDLDDDDSGELSKDEFQDVISDPKAVAIMRDISVDTEHLHDISEMLYSNEDTSIPISVIMNIVLSLRGKKPLSMDDMAKGHNFLLWAFESRLNQHRQSTVDAVQNMLRLNANSMATSG